MKEEKPAKNVSGFKGFEKKNKAFERQMDEDQEAQLSQEEDAESNHELNKSKSLDKSRGCCVRKSMY